MKIKPGISDILWMAAGAVLLLIIMLVVLHFHTKQSPDEQLASKARRLDLVEQMRFNLSSAAEAEKSAVMAITDKDSQTYADEARVATAQVEQGRKEMGIFLRRTAPRRRRIRSRNSPRRLPNSSTSTTICWPSPSATPT